MTEHPFRQHSSHWGSFSARLETGGLTVRPDPRDPDPSPLLGNIPASLSHPARLTQPLIRRGWLKDGPGPDSRRGQDDHVAVPWDEALDMAAAELRRLGAGAEQAEGEPVPGEHVFGGSYGWSSAGRFHHAQSQVHRFLNTAFGGYVRSVESYSSGAGAVILSLVRGTGQNELRDQPFWEEIATESDLVIAFGGLALRNMQVAPGGITQHIGRGSMERAAARGCRFVSVSPVADDIPDLQGLSRIAPRPGTDTAMMLGMAFRLVETGAVDRDWLARYTSGYEQFERYLTGASDGVPKTPEWAAEICAIGADTIRDLADRAAAGRTHITVAYGLQRSRNGEQPVWMALTLASMLGQSDLPGGGFSYSLGSMGSVGKLPLERSTPSLPQGNNRARGFIPVARIAELLLKPGEPFTYRGETHRYPDIRLVYWAGGNPFHHHQDLARLTRAFARPETIILHDSVGTASARHADIVFPATITAERLDIGGNSNDPFLTPMLPLAERAEGVRDDYEIFAALASRLGCEAAYTEGLDSRGWVERLYRESCTRLSGIGHAMPDFETFLQGSPIEMPLARGASRMMRFFADPDGDPLATPSGKIEICSDIVARAGLKPHPAWSAPDEWLGAEMATKHPFQLVANQPARRLHSQLDFGPFSMAGKRDGRETARLNPADAARLGIGDGDVIRLWNQRGAVLATAMLDDGIASSVVQLPTGAWYAPVDLPGSGLTCVNGNPNAVTSDVSASALSQGCAGQLCLVSVERWDGEVPATVPHERIMPRTI